MGSISLSDESKKELNRIRPFVKKTRVKGKGAMAFSDIVNFLIRFYKEAKK